MPCGEARPRAVDFTPVCLLVSVLVLLTLAKKSLLGQTIACRSNFLPQLRACVSRRGHLVPGKRVDGEGWSAGGGRFRPGLLCSRSQHPAAHPQQPFLRFARGSVVCKGLGTCSRESAQRDIADDAEGRAAPGLQQEVRSPRRIPWMSLRRREIQFLSELAALRACHARAGAPSPPDSDPLSSSK